VEKLLLKKIIIAFNEEFNYDYLSGLLFGIPGPISISSGIILNHFIVKKTEISMNFGLENFSQENESIDQTLAKLQPNQATTRGAYSFSILKKYQLQ
jgi:hypothetical protein